MDAGQGVRLAELPAGAPVMGGKITAHAQFQDR